MACISTYLIWGDSFTIILCATVNRNHDDDKKCYFHDIISIRLEFFLVNAMVSSSAIVYAFFVVSLIAIYSLISELLICIQYSRLQI